MPFLFLVWSTILPPENLVVSGWAFSQLQAIIAAPSDKRATELGMEIVMRIVEWGQGAVDDEWFQAELRKIPWAPIFGLAVLRA